MLCSLVGLGQGWYADMMVMAFPFFPLKVLCVQRPRGSDQQDFDWSLRGVEFIEMIAVPPGLDGVVVVNVLDPMLMCGVVGIDARKALYRVFFTSNCVVSKQCSCSVRRSQS